MHWRLLNRPKFSDKLRVWLALQPVTLYHWQRPKQAAATGIGRLAKSVLQNNDSARTVCHKPHVMPAFQFTY